jgi:hypothetical protein
VYVGCAEAAAAVEVRDCREDRVDRGGFAVGDRLQVGAVVADRAVAGCTVVEGVTVEVGGVEPDQVAA